MTNPENEELNQEILDKIMAWRTKSQTVTWPKIIIVDRSTMFRLKNMQQYIFDPIKHTDTYAGIELAYFSTRVMTEEMDRRIEVY